MSHSNNTLLNHYIAGDSYEDIAAICGIPIEDVRAYMVKQTSEDLAEVKPTTQTLYSKRHVSRLERGLTEEAGREV